MSRQDRLGGPRGRGAIYVRASSFDSHSVPPTLNSKGPHSELNTLDTEKRLGFELRIYGYDDTERPTAGGIVERQGRACLAPKPVGYRVLWPDVHRVLGFSRPGQSESSHIALGRVLNGGRDRRSLRLHSRRSWLSSEVETAIAGWVGTLCYARVVCRYSFNTGSLQCIHARCSRLWSPIRKTVKHVR